MDPQRQPIRKANPIFEGFHLLLAGFRYVLSKRCTIFPINASNEAPPWMLSSAGGRCPHRLRTGPLPEMRTRRIRYLHTTNPHYPSFTHFQPRLVRLEFTLELIFDRQHSLCRCLPYSLQFDVEGARTRVFI